MNHIENTLTAQDGPVDAALAAYFARLDRRESVDLDDLIAAYPGCEAGLRRFLDQELILQQAVAEKSTAVLPLENLAGRTLGDFRILREIGRGGMGIVYEAQQLSLRRRVALKTLPFAVTLTKQQLSRFQNEARAAAALDHPNIVAVYSVGFDGGVHYYAMQLIEGQSLAEQIATMQGATDHAAPQAGELLNDPVLSTDAVQRTTDYSQPATRHGPAHARAEVINSVPTLAPSTPPVEPSPRAQVAELPDFQSPDFYRKVAQLGIQAAEALDHAHQNGVLHRDIKPGNLMLDGVGKLFVTDFGLARIEAEAGMTLTEDMIGTLRYMAPEQALGKRAVVDQRCDIYSLGVTLYELLTLQPAFGGDDRPQVLRQIAFDEPRKPREINRRIPSDLETIVLKTMEKEAGDRYSTAQELANDLQLFLAGEPILARRPSLVHRARKWARRHVGLLAAAAVLMLLATIGAGVSTMLIAQERTTAQQSAAQSRENLNLALQALDGALSELFIGDLSEGRSRITKKQRELMRRGVHFYEELATQNGVDPTTWPTYLTLLRSSTLENAYELGETGRIDEADKAYQEAIAQAEQLQASFEPNSQKRIDARGALAACCNDYATFLLKNGDLKTAARHLLKAREIFEEHRGGNPHETKGDIALGQNHYNMGLICTKAGRQRDAEESYSQALPLLELAVRTRPEKLSWRQTLAMCQYNLGHLLGNVDRSEEARNHWKKSLVEWQRLASDDPFVSEYHCRVGATLNNLGVLAQDRGDLTKARKLFEQALVHQKRAVAQQPVYKLAHEFMGHHYRGLTEVLDKLGDAEARAAIEKERMEWQSSTSFDSNRVE